MATKDDFWRAPSTRDALAIGYALGVLADLSYTNSQVLLDEWAATFELPYASVILTPGRVTPNLMICGEPTRLLVVVPGTTNLTQMLGNIEFSGQRTNPDFGPSRMHDFFLSCAESILGHLGGGVNSFPVGTEVTFVGHSLGAAVAQLLADWTVQQGKYTVRYCYCYNSPRVGSPVWAQRSRPYATRLYYSSHDMVCELPPSVSFGLVDEPTPAGNISGYEHRDAEVRIVSNSTLVPAWIASGVSTGAFSAAGGGIVSGGRALARNTIRQLLAAGWLFKFISWASSVPVWIADHKMRRLLELIRVQDKFHSIPEDDDLLHIIGFLEQGADFWTGLPNSARFMVDPLYFCGLRIANPTLGINQPLLPPGGRIEVVEGTWSEDNAPEFFGGPSLTNTNVEAANAVARYARDTGLNPLAATTPIVAPIPPRPNWLFNGKDRRLLEKLWSVMNAIDNRDYQAAFGSPTAALSTRELIIDADTQDAWDELRFYLGSVLSLYYAPVH